jgi:hypothetical protein
LQTFERLPVGVNKVIEKDHTVISHDTSRLADRDDLLKPQCVRDRFQVTELLFEGERRA